MKKNITLWIAILSMAFSHVAFAQETSATGTHETVSTTDYGQLSTVVTNTACDSLTISGFMDSNDFSFINDSLLHVKYLNMKEVTVLNNAISYSLNENTSLSEVILPAGITSIYNSFNNCYRLSQVTFTGATPPSISSSSSLNYQYLFYVPEGTKEAYTTALGNDKVIIEEGKEKKVTIALTSAGTLGEEMLKQVDNAAEINELVISGPLNSDDFYQIQSRMTNLISIDMSGVQMDNLPDFFFQGREALLNIKLPITLKSIGASAFQYCYGLSNIEMPETIQSIGNSAFSSCYALDKINLPNQLSTITSGIFSGCLSLAEIEIPEGVTSIEGSAFRYCISLSEIEIPEGVTSIESGAFYSCTYLSKVTFPSTLKSIGYYAFYNNKLSEITLPGSVTFINSDAFFSDSIQKITCLASIPPCNESDGTYSNYNILSFYSQGEKNIPIPLFVPRWSINTYKLTQGWENFTNILPLDIDPDTINVHNKLIITEDIRFTNEPTVLVQDKGALTVRGTDALSMTKFTQAHNLENYSDDYVWNGSEYVYSDNSQYTSVLSESTAMRADSVIYHITTPDRKWVFFSLPFDASVADIIAPEGTLYALRSYDSATRADGTTSNWKDVAADATLKAGEGYIIQTNQIATITFKAINNDNKNRLFAGSELSQTLNEYTSEFAHNASWNFVGNPFPCYYDIYYMGFTGPLTVWNRNGYTAVSPIDDDYILRPMQAFFVQKPVDATTITYPTEGRQTDNNIRQHVVTRSNISGDRQLINLTLSNDTYTDKTRIVINPIASMEYEISRDASKFMSDNKDVPQIYSLDNNGNRYAINERPLGQGNIALGVYIGKSGYHTIALATDNKDVGELILIDKENGKEIRLDQEAYTFSAEAGNHDKRFELRLSGMVTSIGQPITEEDDVKVTTLNGAIHITASAGSIIKINTISGQIITHVASTSENTTIHVPAGFYIATINGKSYKVMVSK